MTIKEIIKKLNTTIADHRGHESHFESWLTLIVGICDAINALKELDKQEPVAWTEQQFFDDGTPHSCSALKWAGRNEQDDFPVGTKFYTTPPQRKPLTYEQLDSLWQTTDTGDFELDIREFARAIEDAHGIKE